ncbi:uncharacterized protein V1516DRAFT_679612 [Lipomyces oligophaga]|uniref:uncharacterized protein n=1 Tax=Lipomyces oligophaga TaxID=45792 RepID=UPI0034CE0E43
MRFHLKHNKAKEDLHSDKSSNETNATDVGPHEFRLLDPAEVQSSVHAQQASSQISEGSYEDTAFNRQYMTGSLSTSEELGGSDRSMQDSMRRAIEVADEDDEWNPIYNDDDAPLRGRWPRAAHSSARYPVDAMLAEVPAGPDEEYSNQTYPQQYRNQYSDGYGYSQEDRQYSQDEAEVEYDRRQPNSTTNGLDEPDISDQFNTASQARCKSGERNKSSRGE